MTAISTAGVAFKNGKVFIVRRRPGTSIGERWEFPGGKALASEDPRDALAREFGEELGVKVSVGEELCRGTFSNRGISYDLIAFIVDMGGDPRLREHQEYAWAAVDELQNYDFADSDRIILKALKLVFNKNK